MGMSGGKLDGEPMMEMNMTPLIDVLLVLLIMFIITIPVATHSVDIDLPTPQPPTNPPPIDPIKNKIVLTPDNQILWNGTPINEALDMMLRSYIESLPYDRRKLLSRYRIVDSARKVVGVGSVGTGCWVILLQGVEITLPMVGEGLARIGELARRHDLWVVVDEVYAGLAPEGRVPPVVMLWVVGVVLFDVFTVTPSFFAYRTLPYTCTTLYGSFHCTRCSSCSTCSTC